MTSYKIARLRTRYVVPFEFDTKGGFSEICSRIDRHRDDLRLLSTDIDSPCDGMWRRESLHNGEQDLYGHIIDEFSAPAYDADAIDARSGCFWSFNALKDSPLKLKFSFDNVVPSSQSSYELILADMGLYIFRSGIGFLWYEIKTDKRIAEDSQLLIRYQGKIKELNVCRGGYLWIDSGHADLPADAEAGDVIPFTLGTWIAERLSFLDVSYQACRDNIYTEKLREYFGTGCDGERKDFWQGIDDRVPKSVPDKALMFTYVLFEKPDDNKDEWVFDDDARHTVFYLNNGYNNSYDFNQDSGMKMRSPFGNVLWMATREGAGYYAWVGENNRLFFTINQYERVMNDYFIMYIRAIYQSFTLMKYAVLTSELLPDELDEYIKISGDTEELSEKINRLCTEINLFLVKSVVTSVSHIQHQNDFYSYLCGQLRIGEDIKSVTLGLDSLSRLQQRTLERKQAKREDKAREERMEMEQREKQADNDFQLGLGLMTLLVFFSAATDAYGIISNIAENTLTGGWLVTFWISFALCVLVFGYTTYSVIKGMRNNRIFKRDNKK